MEINWPRESGKMIHCCTALNCFFLCLLIRTHAVENYFGNEIKLKNEVVSISMETICSQKMENEVKLNINNCSTKIWLERNEKNWKNELHLFLLLAFSWFHSFVRIPSISGAFLPGCISTNFSSKSGQLFWKCLKFSGKLWKFERYFNLLYQRKKITKFWGKPRHPRDVRIFHYKKNLGNLSYVCILEWVNLQCAKETQNRIWFSESRENRIFGTFTFKWIWGKS